MFIGKQAKKGINVVEGGRTALATYLVHPVYKQMIVMVTNYVDLQINDFETKIFKNERKKCDFFSGRARCGIVLLVM